MEGEPKRLLVLGPDEEVRNPSFQVLFQEGYTLHVEEDSYRSFLSYLDNPPSAVLLFPDSFFEDELMVIHRMKEVFPSIPVLVLALEEGKEMGMRAMANGADCYLPLPILPGEMQLLISSCARSGKSVSGPGKKEEASQLRTVAGGVAHWINNPLTTILGWTEFLLKSSSQENESNALDSILKEGKKIQTIVRALEGFAEDRPLQQSQIDLHALLTEFIKSLRTAREGLVIRDRLEDGPSIVRGDREKILSLFQELYENAHTNSAPKSVLEIRSVSNKKNIEVYFQDSGRGIPEHHQERIFEPFFTIKAERDRPGLGLAFCRGVMEAHGGEIQVISRPGEGSTFTLLFPKSASLVSTPETSERKD